MFLTNRFDSHLCIVLRNMYGLYNFKLMIHLLLNQVATLIRSNDETHGENIFRFQETRVKVNCLIIWKRKVRDYLLQTE